MLDKDISFFLIPAINFTILHSKYSKII
jgi:hypothetical protein